MNWRICLKKWMEKNKLIQCHINTKKKIPGRPMKQKSLIFLCVHMQCALSAEVFCIQQLAPEYSYIYGQWMLNVRPRRKTTTTTVIIVMGYDDNNKVKIDEVYGKVYAQTMKAVHVCEQWTNCMNEGVHRRCNKTKKHMATEEKKKRKELNNPSHENHCSLRSKRLSNMQREKKIETI